jgi:hypothetical protein
MRNPQFSGVGGIAYGEGQRDNRDSSVKDRKRCRTKAADLKWISLDPERYKLIRLWNQTVKERTTETTFRPHSIDQCLPSIARQEEDVAIIARPVRRSHAPIQR